MDNDDIKSLLPIEERDEKQLVNARMLHEFLEVGRVFSSWIKGRIDQYDFWKDEDYVRFTPDSVKTQGGRPATEYGLTLDMAKELCMVENNAKGREARRYFIRCEKKLKTLSIPTHAEALRLAADHLDRAEEAEKRLAIAAPKARDFDITMEKFKRVNMDVAAQIIGHPRLGRNNLFKFLRNEKILKSGINDKNVPYSQYAHHFKVIMKRCGSGSSDEVRPVTLVKASGISFIIGRIIKEYGEWVGTPSKKEIRRQVEANAEEE